MADDPNPATLSSQSATTDDDVLPDLNPDKVCFVIVKARELNAQDDTGGEDGSNDSDDSFTSALTEANDEPVRAELRGFLAALDADEQMQIVALMLIGRGDFGKDEWKDAVAAAADRGEPPTVVYLMQTPLLADYLEEGLSIFDMSCEDFERGRL